MLPGMHHDVQPALLAHPERCRAFHEDPDLLGRLVGQGMLAQVTAASAAGSYGSAVQPCAWTRLVHVIASDAHDAIGRPPLLREPLEAVRLDRIIIATLCEQNPAAILVGERPIPAAPVTPPRSIRRRRLRAGVRRP
jgi:protein-tyrosine phosphatase